MTDNEIIKTFAEATKDALDLIERQQAEIERLKFQLAVKNKKIEIICGIAGAIRKQSIEKFAERLREKNVKIIDQNGVLHYVYESYEVADLVKEMTEKEDENDNI